MTRRITVAILLTVWAILLASAIVAYVTTRSVLLRNLDESLVARAVSLPQIVDDQGRRLAPVSALRGDDRYIVRTDVGQTVGRPTTNPAVAAAPQLLHAAFSPMPGGGRMRTVTLRALGTPAPGATPVPLTLAFSGSAAEFDRLLMQLAWALGAAGVIGALLSAAIARWVATRCLRPLRAAADVVGSIDERSLDRRIDRSHLPTELSAVAGRINDMLARLEESLRKRRQFTADASHELRTPVAALVTAIEVALRRDRAPDQYRQTLETCLADAHVLQRLVESLLTQVKSELAASQQACETVDVADLVRDCVKALRPLAEQREIVIDIESPPQLELHTQPDRIRSILMNLVGNAVEHIAPGERVSVSVSAKDRMLLLRVRDTGQGIAAEHRDHLFEPFYRADTAHGASGHLGLGLYLVKTHTRALGGSCGVVSEPGEGAIFDVRLPGVIHAPAETAPTPQYVNEG
jgi:signal transduction histidine kinase